MQSGVDWTRLAALGIASAARGDSRRNEARRLRRRDEMRVFARRLASGLFVAVGLASLAVSPAQAQVRSVDPNAALAADDVPVPPPPVSANNSMPVDPGTGPNDVATDAPVATIADTSGTVVTTPATTYRKDDVIGAAENVFGKGAKGLAEIVEKILKDQGEPNAYIAGREASAALVVGLRYGSGTLSHTVEGQRPVYWTGPSVGFDVGGDAAKTFVLVYNLYDSQDLYRRYPQVEGRAFFVGGFSATYLRRGDVAIIPIRLGVGVRLGANVGYMKFSEKSKWMPF
jgi:hypothetical protein